MNQQCPCCGYMEDRLIVTGTTSPVTVDIGMASLHGLMYCNTEPVDIDIPTPASMPRIDRIVLRINWEKQKVRLAHILGNEGADAPPMEVDDKILDEPLACCFIGVDGLIRIDNEPGFEVLPWQPLDNLP